jgi:acetolactate synthase-1/2/3 large subunit
MRPRSAPPVLDAAAVEEAVALLAGARHPVIMAGQGCAGAPELVRALAEVLPAPVFTTLSGRGVLPEDHPLAFGYDFVRGDVRVLNELVRRSDCVLVLGCKLSAAGTDAFRLELPADRLIHVDAGAEVLGATYAERVAVTGPVESFLEHLLQALPRRRPSGTVRWTPSEIEEWTARLRAPSSETGMEPSFPASSRACERHCLGTASW